MKLIKATEKEIDELLLFYHEVAEKYNPYSRWVYGVYPTDEIIKDYVLNGSMYFTRQNNLISSAVAITDQNKSYHGKKWSVSLPDDQVSVLHILAVSPSFQRQGIAKETVKSAISLCRFNNKKSVRLDALSLNLPAQHLYEQLGFRKVDFAFWYAENTDWATFYLYEFFL